MILTVKVVAIFLVGSEETQVKTESMVKQMDASMKYRNEFMEGWEHNQPSCL
jgi:hypothetical protein